MKKISLILSLLILLPLSFANATDENFVIEDDIVDTVQMDDTEVQQQDLPPIRESIDAIKTPEEAITVLKEFDYVKHLDLRDVIKFDDEVAKTITDDDDRLPGTSLKILQAIEEDEARFINPLIEDNGILKVDISVASNIVYYKKGAEGHQIRKKCVQKNSEGKCTKAAPLSYTIENNVFKPILVKKDENGEVLKDENGNSVKSDYVRDHTRTNTIFSADYISAKKIDAGKYNIKLLLFAHDAQRGHFFRRITVRVDWSKFKTGGLAGGVSTLSVGRDIPLSETDFNLRGSIADQKIILEDKVNGLVKIFPVTVGALDVRTTTVQPMTFWVPDFTRKGKTGALAEEFQDFSNAALVKRSVWKTGSHNTASRNYPADYKGRPFIGLVDMNFVKDGEFSRGYREIGLHYQILQHRLARGFKSHGCIRVRDKDLYQLDAMINSGPKDMIQSEFKLTLPNDSHLNHPHKYEKTYSKVLYTETKSEYASESIPCEARPKLENGVAVDFTIKSRKIRWNDTSVKRYHTLIGNDCLTKVGPTDSKTIDAYNYLTGKGGTIYLELKDTDHPPIIKARTELSKAGYSVDDINYMAHKDRMILAQKIKLGMPTDQQPIFVDTMNDDFGSGPVVVDPTDDGPIAINKPVPKRKKRRKSLFEQLFDNSGNSQPEPQVKSKWPRYRYKMVSNRKYQRIKSDLLNKKVVSNARKKQYYTYLYQMNCIEEPNEQESIDSCPMLNRQMKKYKYRRR